MIGRFIVCIAPTEWEGAWQRYHEMMRRLAGAGNRVLVVDNLYRVLPAVPQSAAGALRILHKAWRAVLGFRLQVASVDRSIAVFRPPVLPGRFSRLLWPVLRVSIRRAAGAPGASRPVLWVAFPTPLVEAVVRALEPALVVYDCASAFADDPTAPRGIADAEGRLLRIADLVFTDSHSLWERHRARHAQCFWIPTGVDSARFEAARPGRRRWSEPVVGYSGTLHAWLDVDLIVQVTRLRPRWRFVFVGPRRERADLEVLEAQPNVEFVGAVPHDDLPGLLAQFSAAWIPYQVTPFTRAVFPTKMLEYLAAGLSVVSTDLPEVRRFAPPLRIASDAPSVAAALEAALRSADSDAARALARQFDWSAQMQTLHAHLDAALEGRRR